MKSRKELKQEAKDALRGRWGSAMVMNIVPGLLIMIIVWIVIVLVSLPLMANTVISETVVNNSSGEMDLATALAMIPSLGGTTLVSLVAGLVGIVIQSGINFTYLDAIRGRKEEPYRVADAFRCFRSPYLLGLIVIFILVSIFSYLWALLLVIPGIIKSYSYAQSYFIYYDIYEGTGEKPDALECITASRRLMDGYKWQLFVLDLSFIGWGILASITVIGLLWFIPYYYTTRAAFYNALPDEAVTF
ncbi:DUF975 family protein [Enterococcus asini]|uniref:DUF975 family protein n=1 Tax=Enterococcus TaxID=1350 RepID=UPI002890F2A2|nr:DUF975 family protein [Enterococcus asini]MDT2757413.1 DUF975 family protein [Enterococcus asini]